MSLTRCNCTLTDCHYWNKVDSEPSPPACDCSHTDKPHYMSQPCPLYRKEWDKRGDEYTDLKNKFFKKRR